MSAFRVKKYSTLNVSCTGNQRNQRSISCNQNRSVCSFDAFIKIANLKLDFIQQKQNSQLTQSKLYQPQQCNIQMQLDASYPAGSLDSIKNQNSKSSRPKTRIQNKRSLMHLLRNRQNFIEQYGYIIQKNKQKIQQVHETIDVTPDYGKSSQKLFLSEVETMKIQKRLQENATKVKAPCKKSKKQRENINRIINQIQSNGKLENKRTQSSHFKQSKRILQIVESKPEKKKPDINITKLTNRLMKFSDRIYGPKHVSDSVVWCTDVLAAQYEDPYATNSINNETKNSIKNRARSQSMKGSKQKSNEEQVKKFAQYLSKTVHKQLKFDQPIGKLMGSSTATILSQRH